MWTGPVRSTQEFRDDSKFNFVRQQELSPLYSIQCNLQANRNVDTPSTYLFPKRQILDSSKLRAYEDDNFKFIENSIKFSEWVENAGRKGEIARHEQFLLFPQCF